MFDQRCVLVQRWMFDQRCVFDQRWMFVQSDRGGCSIRRYKDGALEARYRCSDVEAWSSGGAL